MSRNNEPTVDDLQQFINETKVTFASCSWPVNKDLKINLRGGFEAYHNGELVWRGMQPAKAIDKFNAI